MPVLTVFAGPNGSGKSSVMREPAFVGSENLLDPDAIARRINPSDPSRAAVAAGREVILRTRRYLEDRQSFGIETTLSSSSTLATMEAGIDRGFTAGLCLPEHPGAEYQTRAGAVRTRRAFVPDDLTL